MKKWIVIGGPNWHTQSVTSTKQIAKQFLENGYSLLWINPIPFKSVFVNSSSSKSLRKRIVNKLITHLKIFKKAENEFNVYVPLYIPLFDRYSEFINILLIRFQIEILFKIFKIKRRDSLLWISGAFTLLQETRYNYKKKIYHAADLISDFRNANRELKLKLREKEKSLCQNSDVVFACTDTIRRKLEDLSSRRVELLHHGVNFEHFNKSVPLASRIRQIKDTGLPVAGYYGSLSDANSKDVFLHLAQNGFSVVLIGAPVGDYSQLERQENVHFLGPVAYDELPSYAQGFDVCLMNWVQADWIQNCFPIKTLEYLAMGKRVVSCDIPIVKQLFGEFVSFANTPEEFLHEARIAIQDYLEVDRARMVNSVKEFTWENRFTYIREVLE